MSITADPIADEPEADPSPLDPASGRLLMRALVVGAMLEIGLRGGLANGMIGLAIVVTVRALWTDDRLRRRESRLIVLASFVPVLFLAVRASPWLAWSNVLLATAMLIVGVIHARHGSILDSTPAQLVLRAVSGLERGVRRLSIVRSIAPRVSTDQRDGLVRVSRGLLVAVPVLVVLVALLASADAVFASLLTPNVDATPVMGHVLLTLLLAPILVVLTGAASAEEPPSGEPGGFGVIEVTTILGLLGAVLALFVISQLVALTDAGDRLVESAGLTPAEYARSGFFQLCWATGLLLAFLAVVRAHADPAARRNPVVVALSAAVPVLALGLVIVSLRRMALYDDAFGLTMLRLWVVGAAIWMGSVLAMTALRNLGIGSGRDWLLAGAGLVGALLVVMANLVSPEALVARHNFERAQGGADLDIGYLATLSDDVVPVIVDATDVETDPVRREALRRALRCGDDAGGIAMLNLATSRATDLREEDCES